MASSRARSSDIKLIASATIAVVLAGLFIAGGMLIATSSKWTPTWYAGWQQSGGTGSVRLDAG